MNKFNWMTATEEEIIQHKKEINKNVSEAIWEAAARWREKQGRKTMEEWKGLPPLHHVESV